MIPYTTAAEIFDFWKARTIEHFLFLHLGLTESQENARRFKQEMFQYYQIWLTAVLDPRLPGLIEQSRLILTNLLNFLNTCTWAGYIYPGLVEHYLEELDYFNKKLYVGMSREDEVKFWMDVFSDHSSTTAALLNPSHRAEIHEGERLSDELKDVMNQIPRTEESVYLRLSLELGQQLTDYVHDIREASAQCAIKSIASPDFQRHLDLENQLGMQILEYLKKFILQAKLEV